MKSNPHIKLPAQGKTSGESDMPSDCFWTLTSTRQEHLLATHGKTFSFAARFFPTAVRRAVVSLYAFFRTLDDLVDERGEGWCRNDVGQELDAWHYWFACGARSDAPREPLGTILASLQETYQIPVAIFDDFLDGLRSDLEPVQARDFLELYHYCYQVAGTVGIAMSYVLGVHSEQARLAAKQLGIAMQLTNILRDLGSDLSVGRIYLPCSELEHFGSSSQHLLRLYQAQKGPDERFRALMRYQIQRARFYYQESLQGVWLLTPDCRLPILLAGRLYRNILREIERSQYDVLRQRASTSWLTKLGEAGIVFLLDLLWRNGEVTSPAELECVYEE
ncbi:phytoene/squalene synthase family protein [Ktedonosporobacter rubrisoli]|uniref:Phytoene/squalene synthase family protein n=1 Tax=Ktedonosporobacter rubrisoli TaxID=2509675 RepID=A0A4P6JQA5_KTERU|nr:phytoene/squalene synthase family protein [Ktedonosporobacter rubrisoli]QBD77360.1 phytoene/squalene synthase family protein [Ktedonosporobacter rubrisoli]